MTGKRLGQSLLKLIETQSKETLANWEQIEQCNAEECGRIEAALRIIAKIIADSNRVDDVSRKKAQELWMTEKYDMGAI